MGWSVDVEARKHYDLPTASLIFELRAIPVPTLKIKQELLTTVGWKAGCGRNFQAVSWESLTDRSLQTPLPSGAKRPLQLASAP
jgi:hypothetical protein